MELSLPPDKLMRITAMMLEWREKRVATKRELQYLIGTLSHAATVFTPGRAFLRRMIETMKVPKCQHHHVRLNIDFRSDIQWWASFLPQWNGISILSHAQAMHSVRSDASGSWGCGAVSDSAHWFQVEWPESWQGHHIAAKEMVPVVVAMAVWGHEWYSSTVEVLSDNMSVVCALTAGMTKDPLMMQLLRCLHFFTAHFQIVVEAHHIAGVDNIAADALSRNKLDVFFSCSPQAVPSTSPIPQSLLDMLLHSQPDWTAPSWRNSIPEKALAPSTLRSYGTGQRHYMVFCQQASLHLLPFSEQVLCKFVEHLASEGLTHQTIKSYLSAIRHFHITAGQGDPFIDSAFPMCSEE